VVVSPLDEKKLAQYSANNAALPAPNQFPLPVEHAANQQQTCYQASEPFHSTGPGNQCLRNEHPNQQYEECSRPAELHQSGDSLQRVLRKPVIHQPLILLLNEVRIRKESKERNYFRGRLQLEVKWKRLQRRTDDSGRME
jgi:hypothetical protein